MISWYKLAGSLLCMLIVLSGQAQTLPKIKIKKPKITIALPDSVRTLYEKKIVYDKGMRTTEQNENNTLKELKDEPTQDQLKSFFQKDLATQVQEALKPAKKGIVIEDGELEDYLEEQINPASKKRRRGPTQYDSRIELRSLNPLESDESRIISNAQSVGLIIRKENLQPVTDSFYRINTNLTLGDKYGLCIGEAFATQPVAGEGTAFLIQGKEPQVMTASHVLTGPAEHYAVVFGYEMINQTGLQTLIPVANIYYLTKVLYKDDQLDVAIAALNKPTDRSPLSFSVTAPAKEQEVYMIGYPCGLPAKVAMNAAVKENNHPQYFYTSLDAFQGNSGSPVFNMDTHEIIGILVSGAVDFVWNGSCNRVTSCRIPYCKGEKAIRVQAISDYTISQTPPGGSLLSLPQ